MAAQDWFVAAMAAVVGTFFIVGAALGRPWLMELPRNRMLAESVGRGAARLLVAIFGLAILALGGLIVSGWRMPW